MKDERREPRGNETVKEEPSGLTPDSTIKSWPFSVVKEALTHLPFLSLIPMAMMV